MTISTFFAVGTIVFQVFIIGVVLDLLFLAVTKKASPGVKFLRKYGPEVALLFSLAAVAGSLIYSEAIGFVPCSLCWWQRVFLYPTLPILALGVWKKDRTFAPLYALSLTILAAVVGLYHSYIQYGGSPIGNCGAGAVSCVQRVVWEFGYITLPLMSLSVAVAMGLILYVFLSKHKS